MDNKLSELSKPVAWEISNPGEGTYFIEHEPQAGDYRRDLIISQLYSQEYVSALRADAAKWFEAFQKAVSIGARYEERIAELEAKLAPPVQLQNCDFESVAIMAHWCTDEQLEAWVKGVEHAKKQIRAAGFKVEGDE